MTWTPPDWTAYVLFLQYIANHLVLAALSHTLTLLSLQCVELMRGSGRL